MSYKTRQVQTCLKIKQILDKSNLVFNNPINLCQTKLDKSKLVLNNSVDSFPPFFFFLRFDGIVVCPWTPK